MRTRACLLMLLLAVAGCSRDTSPTPANAVARSTASGGQASTTVGGVTLQTSTVDIATLNPAVAQRYAIPQGSDGLMLLVTVRDAGGNAASDAGLQLQATAAVLPAAPAPLPLRKIVSGDLIDYIGVVATTAPATVQFKLVASTGGSRSEVATTAELYPR